MNRLRKAISFSVMFMAVWSLCACGKAPVREIGSDMEDVEAKTKFFAMDIHIRFTAYGVQAEEALEKSRRKTGRCLVNGYECNRT